MGILGYENGRVNFDRIVRHYRGYLALYRDMNGGSLEGHTPFAEFYWHMTYHSKYQARRSFG